MSDLSPDALESLIHRRTSGMTIDRDTAVPREIIERIVATGGAAPNHRTTRPLRVAVLQDDARFRFGETLADEMARRGDDTAKVEKTRTKYGRAPVVLVVGSADGETDLETEENRYTVAAAIQNMLLMIESFGLRALWSTPPKGTDAAISHFCEFEPHVHTIGIVYLGSPTTETPTKARPAPIVTWID